MIARKEAIPMATAIGTAKTMPRMMPISRMRLAATSGVNISGPLRSLG